MMQAYFRIVIPDEKRAELLNLLFRLKGPTEASSRCLACWVSQDLEDEGVLTYFVRWKTQEDLEEHLRSERFRRILPYIDLSVENPVVSFGTIDRECGMEFLIGLLSPDHPGLRNGEDGGRIGEPTLT
jgi:quinol monooxygenase YgiN